MFVENADGHGGHGDDEEPWSRERFSRGDRVKYTAKAIRRNIPTKTRRGLHGIVTAVETGSHGLTFSVSVLWDGYKRPHRYAGSFITKACR